MDVSARLAGIAPWSGLIAAGSAFALHHQVMSNALHFDCRSTSGAVGIALGVAALGLVAGGAFASWRARPAAAAPAQDAALRRFIVHLSLMAAMLAALGIGWQVLAAALLPGCPP